MKSVYIDEKDDVSALEDVSTSKKENTNFFDKPKKSESKSFYTKEAFGKAKDSLILNLTIELEDQKEGSLPIYKGDNIENLTLNFIKKYSLDPLLKSPLSKIIADKILESNRLSIKSNNIDITNENTYTTTQESFKNITKEQLSENNLIDIEEVSNQENSESLKIRNKFCISEINLEEYKEPMNCLSNSLRKDSKNGYRIFDKLYQLALVKQNKTKNESTKMWNDLKNKISINNQIEKRKDSKNGMETISKRKRKENTNGENSNKEINLRLYEIPLKQKAVKQQYNIHLKKYQKDLEENTYSFIPKINLYMKNKAPIATKFNDNSNNLKKKKNIRDIGEIYSFHPVINNRSNMIVKNKSLNSLKMRSNVPEFISTPIKILKFQNLYYDAIARNKNKDRIMLLSKGEECSFRPKINTNKMNVKRKSIFERMKSLSCNENIELKFFNKGIMI